MQKAVKRRLDFWYLKLHRETHIAAFLCESPVERKQALGRAKMAISKIEAIYAGGK